MVEDVGPVGHRETQQPPGPKTHHLQRYSHIGKLGGSGRVLGQAKWSLEENLMLFSLPATLTCR